MKQEQFNLYGMKFTTTGDTVKARSLAFQARRMQFQLGLTGVPKLDLKYSDGSIVSVLRQGGMDFAYIHVPITIHAVERKEKSQRIEIIPYLYASEDEFDSGGILVCRGGLNFSGPYELISPYGETSNVNGYRYQPYDWENPEGETILVEYQVKDFYNYESPVEYPGAEGSELPVYFNEFPWMSDGDSWDPTFYETFLDWYEIEKPYDFVFDPGVYVRESDDPAEYDYYVFTRSESLSINGNVIGVGSQRQWYVQTEEPFPSDKYWYREGSTVNVYYGCLDQTDTSKYGLLYQKRNFYGETLFLDQIVDVETTATEIWFTGLGYNQKLNIASGEYLKDTNIKLYHFGDQYICLLSFQTTNKKYIGSAASGGSLILNDVTSGILYDGEYRDLFIRELPNWLGMILRREPVLIR